MTKWIRSCHFPGKTKRTTNKPFSWTLRKAFAILLTVTREVAQVISKSIIRFSAFLNLLIALPAMALPEHTAPQEETWAQQNTFLLQLRKIQEQQNTLYVSERKATDGSTLRFEALLDQQNPPQVSYETLVVIPANQDRAKASKDYFKEKHRSFFQPLQQLIYGLVLSPDYESITADLLLEQGDQLRYYYRGRKYGYLFGYGYKPTPCAGECGKMLSLSVFSLPDYEQRVGEERARKKSEPVPLDLF